MTWPVDIVPYGITELKESISFTPTVGNLTIGTGGTLLGFRWRMGKVMTVAIHCVLGVGGDVTGDMTFGMPAGELIDDSFFGVDPDALNLEIISVGMASAMIGNQFHMGRTNIIDTATLEVRSAGVGGLWSNNKPGNWSEDDAFHVNFQCPIEDWLPSRTIPD